MYDTNVINYLLNLKVSCVFNNTKLIPEYYQTK